jgi:hypothetical protein
MSRAADQLQDEIAQTAAALVVEEGMDYAGAKQRAARQLGVAGGGRRAELPSNELLEDAVREHISLFCADTQPAELRALRELALPWLERLAEHRPHLGGAVWRGTATRHSALQIDCYPDDPKAVELALINAGQDYDAAEETSAGRGEPLTVLRLACRSTNPALQRHGPVTVLLLLHPPLAERHALKPDARGQAWRGGLAALQRLLAEAPAA